jgi:hypothetical protein
LLVALMQFGSLPGLMSMDTSVSNGPTISSVEKPRLMRSASERTISFIRFVRHCCAAPDP